MAPTAIDLISVICFAHPNQFKLICGSDMDMIRNNYIVASFYNPILQTLLDISFYFYFIFLKTTKLMSIVQNFVPKYWETKVCNINFDFVIFKK